MNDWTNLNLLAYRKLLYTIILEAKNFLPKIKRDLVMACHIQNLSKKLGNKENAINQAQSHPIEKCRI